MGPKVNRKHQCSLYDEGWAGSRAIYRCIVDRLNRKATSTKGIEPDQSIISYENDPCVPATSIRYYFLDSEFYRPRKEDLIKPFIYMGYSCMDYLYSNIVVLFSEDTFSAAYYRNGKIVDSIQKDCKDIKTEGATPVVISEFNKFFGKLTPCSLEDRNYWTRILYQGPRKYEEHLLKQYPRNQFVADAIPLKISKPSIEEVKRVFTKLSTVTRFDSVQEAVKEYKSYCRLFADSETEEKEAPTRRTRAEKASQKVAWPEISGKVQESLFSAIKQDDDNHLTDLITSISNQEQVMDFLNSNHSNLDNRPVLHFATQNGLRSVVQLLLELGCDLDAKDSSSNVPYQLCPNDEIRQLYIDYRNENPDLCSWNKSAIPESLPPPKTAKLSEDTAPQFVVKNSKAKDRREKKANITRQLRDY